MSAGIDYSKFDKIEDSDDEKPAAQSASASSSAAGRPHCQNCHKDIEKALRCGVCKKVAYCSALCQKDDWPYHKRVCKKPEDKAKTSAVEKPSRAPKAADRKPAADDRVVETEENLTWYRHREWKPTEEPKREFSPTLITGDAVVAASAVEATRPKAGSVWNAAGTWEEKDVTAMARTTLRDKLSALPTVDVAGGILEVVEVGEVEGDASKPVIRGKQRHIFDLSFKLDFVFKWMDTNGQQKASGHVCVNDFTNDTFAESVLSPPVVLLSFKEGALLDAGRRQAVEAVVGASTWPPSADTLLDHVRSRMREWAEDYEERH